jgi:hypothetical protein
MFIDVKSAPHNAAGNGLTDDFAAFASADGVSGCIYVPAGTYLIGKDLKISADIHFEQGAVLKPDPTAAAAVTVTLNGALHAGAFQIFDVPFDPATHQPRGNVIPNCVEQLLPQWWGAVGNGVDDDSPPIQAALAVARNPGNPGAGAKGAAVFFPPGVYRITRPLNCTLGQYNLRGSGQFESVLRGATGDGNAIIDLVGAAFCTIEGLLLDTDSDTDTDTDAADDPATVGILCGRVDGGGFGAQSWHVAVRDVTIRLGSDAAANGGNGTVGIYNFCCEVSNYHNTFIRGDTAVLYSVANVFGLASQYQAMFAGESSMTACTISGDNTLVGIAGPALRLHGIGDLAVDAHLNSHAGLTQVPEFLAVPRYPYAIENTSVLSNFEYRGSMETFARVFHTSSLVNGMRLHAYAAYDDDEPRIVVDGGGTIIDSTLNVIPNPETLGEGPLIGDLVATTGQVLTSMIFLRNGTIVLQNPASMLVGNVIVSSLPLAGLGGQIQAPMRTGNVIAARDGAEVSGVTLAGSEVNGVTVLASRVNGVLVKDGTLGIANALAARKPGKVIRKVELFDTAGDSVGFVPLYDEITA